MRVGADTADDAAVACSQIKKAAAVLLLRMAAT
jgi:hypothetical protein